MKNLLFAVLLLVSAHSYANQSIAVLNVELDDWTLLPNIESEVKRTASFKPLLEKALESHYKIVAVDKAVQQAAYAGKSYLFEHDDSSADLGKKLGADWLIVAQHRKPSFLYSHLLVHLINVNTGQLVGNYLVELKGNNQKVTEKSVQSMADKIYQTLNKQ